MRLRTKNKLKKEAKEAQIKRGHKKEKRPKEKKEKEKNERKREKGQCYYPFTTLVLQSSTMIFMIREPHMLSLSYTSGNSSL